MFNKYMKYAIEEAKSASDTRDIPVGAVIVKNGEIIAKAHNSREFYQKSLCHAEIIAIDQACKAVGNWRLSECDMYVTLEPCPMCAGAILQARFRSIYFGAFSKDSGCMGTVIDLPSFFKNTQTSVYGGIMEEECSKLISDFFKELK